MNQLMEAKLENLERLVLFLGLDLPGKRADMTVRQYHAYLAYKILRKEKELNRLPKDKRYEGY